MKFVMYPLLFEANIDSYFLDARPEDSLGVKAPVASKAKRELSSNLGSKFVCNKHITLIIIIDEYLRLNDYIRLIGASRKLAKKPAKV